MNTSLKKTHAAVTGKGSALSKYRQLIVGSDSIGYFLYFEWCLYLGRFPGVLGLALRKIFWPRLFGSCGKGVFFGSDIILRHPKRIHLGDHVVISEGCILDARNNELERVIEIGDDVILSNRVMIGCKNGTVQIGNQSGIGANSSIQSSGNNPVQIGSDVFFGPGCYVVGGGDYNTDRLDIPIWKQGKKDDGGTRIEDNVWLGAKASVLGGVTMRSGSIAAAGSVVTSSVEENEIVAGVPAKVIKKRQSESSEEVVDRRDRFINDYAVVDHERQ